MQALNRSDSLGFDTIGCDAGTCVGIDGLETYRRLKAAGYGESPEDFRPDMAPDMRGPEYFGGEYFGGEYFGGYDDQFGGWNPFKAIAKGVSTVAKGVAKGVTSGVSAVGKLPGVSTAFAPVRLVSDIAQGKNVVSSVRKQAESVVRDTRASLPLAASVVSIVPGAGTGLAAGLSAASALSQGKSLREIAEDAAMGAIPGGQLVKTALRAGINVARGENVAQSLAKGGLEYARSQVPGGQAVQQAITSGLNIARGGNVLREVSPIAQRLVGAQVAKLGPRGASLQFPQGTPPAAIVQTTSAVMRAARSPVPSVFNAARQVVENTKREAASGNRGAQTAMSVFSRVAHRQPAVSTPRLPSRPAFPWMPR